MEGISELRQSGAGIRTKRTRVPRTPYRYIPRVTYNITYVTCSALIFQTFNVLFIRMCTYVCVQFYKIFRLRVIRDNVQNISYKALVVIFEERNEFLFGFYEKLTFFCRELASDFIIKIFVSIDSLPG